MLEDHGSNAFKIRRENDFQLGVLCSVNWVEEQKGISNVQGLRRLACYNAFGCKEQRSLLKLAYSIRRCILSSNWKPRAGAGRRFLLSVWSTILGEEVPSSGVVPQSEVTPELPTASYLHPVRERQFTLNMSSKPFPSFWGDWEHRSKLDQ